MSCTICSPALLLQVESRPAGALQNPKISLANPKEFFGFTRPGFTKVSRRCQGVFCWPLCIVSKFVKLLVVVSTCHSGSSAQFAKVVMWMTAPVPSMMSVAVWNLHLSCPQHLTKSDPVPSPPAGERAACWPCRTAGLCRLPDW
jgi:hypothetical protein